MALTDLPSVVLIHGMWGQPEVWAGWQSKLEAAGYICHPLRLPHHQPDAGPVTLRKLGRTGLADYVDAARQLVDSLPRPPIVIGHSMGGLITQVLAAQVPLAAAILVNTAAPAPIFPLRPVSLPGLIRHFLRPGLWRGTFTLSSREASYLLFNAVPDNQKPQCISTLVHESGRAAYQIAFGPLNPWRSSAVPREKIHCPMLAIAGARDRIVPLSVSQNIAQLYGNQLTYWEYPQHAHWLLGEPGWECVVDRVLGWLLSQSAGGRG